MLQILTDPNPPKPTPQLFDQLAIAQGVENDGAA